MSVRSASTQWSEDDWGGRGVVVVRKVFSCLVRSWIESRDPSGHCPGFHPPRCALLPSSKTETPLRRTLQNF